MVVSLALHGCVFAVLALSVGVAAPRFADPVGDPWALRAGAPVYRLPAVAVASPLEITPALVADPAPSRAADAQPSDREGELRRELATAIAETPLIATDAVEWVPASEARAEPPPPVPASEPAEPLPVASPLTSMSAPAVTGETEVVDDAAAVGDASEPGVLRRIAPAYPARSRRHGEQGRVDLRVALDQQGHPVAVDIATSSGFPRLDEAARVAVRQWLFTPPSGRHAPIRLVSVEFRLR